MNERRQALIRRYYENKMPGFAILMDNVWDPHNVAAVSRTADGLGISTVYLYYTYNQCPNMRQIGSASSSSANRWILFEKVPGIEDFARQKKEEGYVFLGADFRDGAHSLPDYEFPEKAILVMGSESKGISEEVHSILDGYLFIPMVGMVESYNISVAASLIMYELHRQKGRHLSLKVDESLRGIRE